MTVCLVALFVSTSTHGHEQHDEQQQQHDDHFIDDQVLQWLKEFRHNASVLYYEAITANWNYNTNLTDYNQQVT